jgi:hypothetical protein
MVVSVGTLKFGTKASLTKHVRDFLKRHCDADDRRVDCSVAKADIDGWLEPLLKRHPNPAKLAGWTKEAIVTWYMGNPCLFLLLEDGGRREVSMGKCIKAL